MARLSVVDPATATGKAKELFDGPLAQKKINIYKGMANNPAVLSAFLGFAGGVKGAGSLTPTEHELVALAVSQNNGCSYCLAAHTKLAQGLGVKPEATIKARKGASDDPRASAILKFTTAVLEKRGAVGDGDLAAFKKAGFNDAAVIEVVGSMAVNFFANFFNEINKTDLDAAFPPAPKI